MLQEGINRKTEMKIQDFYQDFFPDCTAKGGKGQHMLSNQREKISLYSLKKKKPFDESPSILATY